MVDLGNYAGPILVSYALVFLLVAGLYIRSIMRHRRLKQQLAALSK